MTGYAPSRTSRSEFVSVRGLRYHVRIWEPAAGVAPRGTLFMLHGWMDVAASFQFLVDRLDPGWRVLAPDWRGYGLTEWAHADCYWFPDYLADLDVLLARLSPDRPADLVAHSLGGNVAMLYAGIRPERVGRLVNLEGVGMRETTPDMAPGRYAQWLDELATAPRLRDYATLDEVALRLRANNPRLSAEFAEFLAPYWAQRNEHGRWALLGDPAHKLVNPVLYRLDEVLATWRRITAPVLFVVSEHLSDWHKFVRTDAFRERIAVVPRLRWADVPGAGHMMHHDRPQTVAALIEEFMQ